MNKRVLVALAIALLLTAAGWPEAGDGVGGVEVGIRKTPGRVTARTAKTDAKGAFSFGELEPGAYTLILTITGAQPTPSQATAKSFYESRSNVAREAGQQVLRFKNWSYFVSVGGDGVTGESGTITIVEVRPGARATTQGTVPGARIELALKIDGTVKTTLKGAVRNSAQVTAPDSR